MVGLANPSSALVSQLNIRGVGGEDYDSARAKKSKRGESSRQHAQMGDRSDSEEDLGHSSSVYVFCLAVLSKFTQVKARKFLTAAKGSEKISHAVVSKLKSTVEEGKQKLALVLEGKVLGVYVRWLSTDSTSGLLES